jgi:hypothetical protein
MLVHFLFHRRVDEVEIGYQLTVGFFLDCPLEEAGDEAGILSHTMGFFGTFA